MNARAAFLAFACAAALLPVRAHADSSQGGAFLLPLYGARAWGMAGAVIARIDDESAIDWNPAGVARASRAAGFSYVELVPGAFLTQSQATFVMPLSDARDRETGVVRHAAGVMYTNLGADVGAGQTYSENHLRLAYSYSPQPVIVFGIAGQAMLASSGVEHFDAWGTGVDMAVTLFVTPAWSVAMVGRNTFSRYMFEDGRDEKIERQYVAGIARRLPGAAGLEADFTYVHDGWLRTVVGAETPYLFDRIALRGGAAFLSSGEKRMVYSFGLSARATGHLLLHYAANLDDENAFGTTHRFSLAVGW